MALGIMLVFQLPASSLSPPYFITDSPDLMGLENSHCQTNFLLITWISFSNWLIELSRILQLEEVRKGRQCACCPLGLPCSPPTCGRTDENRKAISLTLVETGVTANQGAVTTDHNCQLLTVCVVPDCVFIYIRLSLVALTLGYSLVNRRERDNLDFSFITFSSYSVCVLLHYAS